MNIVYSNWEVIDEGLSNEIFITIEDGFFDADIEANCINGKSVVWSDIEEAIISYYRDEENEDVSEEILKLAKETLKEKAKIEGYKVI